MIDFNNSSELKDTSSSSQFEKPVNFYNRNQGTFIRPPFPQLRRRMMPGRYPNTGFRPFVRPVFRPDFSSLRGMRMDFNYNTPPNSTLCISPPNVGRPAFPSIPPSNSCNNRNIQYSYSPRPSSVLNCSDQPTTTSQECRNTHTDDQDMSDLWVEALAPNGRIYYYNARTRKTIWEKPINCKIIDLSEINRLTSSPALEHTHNLPMNQGVIMRPLPSSPYANPVHPTPRNFVMSPRLFMFPPPSVCNTTQFFSTPPIETLPNTADSNFNVMVAPPMLSYPMVTDNFVSNNVNIDVGTNYRFMETNINSIQMVSSEPLEDPNKNICKESKILDWSISDSKISICSSESINQSKEVIGEKEDAIQVDCNELDDIKSGDSNQNENKEDFCHSKAISSLDEIKQSSKEKKNERIDKSRPVSSTPISGTQWCVVWTGDERVFFYDYQRKISVWERPTDLLNRFDVDKLVEKPILLMHEKPETTDNESDIGAKKLKKDDENKADISDLNESTGDTEDTKDVSKEDKSVSQEMPHDQRVKLFRELLIENKVSAFSTWEKELHKIIFDSRYALLGIKERRQIFDCYILEKIEDEKLDRQGELNLQKANFHTLLEEAGVTARTRFGDFAQRYGKDIRFKAIEKIKQKENLFNQYVSEIISKEKTSEKLKLELKKDFIRLLSEQNIRNDITWSDLEKIIYDDKRYKNIQSKSLKENIFKEYLQERDEITTSTNAKEERANASIRNREKEVQRDLSIHLKDREREQELHKRISAVSDFKALLNDLIKDSDISWYSARKYLKEDHRWDYSNCLESEEREQLFNEHIDTLISKKKEQFRYMLDELPNITLKTSWLDIREDVLKDPRCSKFSSSERKCEKEFKEYLRQKILVAKADFNQLLKETKIITYKSKSLLSNTNYIRDIEKVLSNDKRYLVLESLRGERKEMLLSYIDKLHDKGPPPPPTASGPSSRSHKH